MSQAVRSRMIYRATLERLTAGATDPDGHPVFNGWTTVVEDLPCLVWTHMSQEAFSQNQVAVVAEIHGWVPKDTDITVGDRLNGVLRRDGSPFSTDIFRVEAVNTRRLSHIELFLKVVK